MDYLDKYKNQINHEEILSLRTFFNEKFSTSAFEKFRVVVNEQPAFITNHLQLNQSFVEIGHAQEISLVQKEKLHKQLEVFMPWRKGPFRLFGIDIDAEWRSDFKWQRIVSHLDNITDKKIADVGCNNGYFMFRLFHFNPSLVIGFDPTYRFQQNFSFLKKHTHIQNIFFELLGFEHLPLYPNFFDVLFNLGILYHHSDPLQVLKNSYAALKKGGQIVIDSITINKTDHSVLYPGKRYAGMNNVHFIPTVAVIKEMLKRVGFRQCQLIYQGVVSEQEQRAGAWSLGKSLADIRDPQNPSLTIEGFPMPERSYLVARK